LAFAEFTIYPEFAEPAKRLVLWYYAAYPDRLNYTISYLDDEANILSL
jgi:hypothetical protein